jgi:ribosome-binding protein aMBF1 (putative translation factor)
MSRENKEQNDIQKLPKHRQLLFLFLQEHEDDIRKDFFSDVVAKLVHERRLLGMTQDTLNGRLGLADNYVNKWECGMKSPTGFNLYCWADALNCEIVIKSRGENE